NFTPYLDATSGTTFLALCGAGPNCAVKGLASAAGAALLRREALDATLQLFKYVPEAKTVLAFLPPLAAGMPPNVLFMRRAAFEPYLRKPLDETLPARRRMVFGRAVPGRPFVDRVTLPRLYQLRLQHVQSGEATLLL